MAGPQIKKGSKETPGTGNPTAAERHRRKVEDAFELVSRIDQEDQPAAARKEQSQKKKTAIRSTSSRSGLRIRFGIDALISERDKAADKEIQSGESKLIDLGITLPYVWKIPVFGKTVLRIVKYLQKEDRPESIRDILKNLRQK